jgi:spore germination cell wall hydrolase CwlJ-like protein
MDVTKKYSDMEIVAATICAEAGGEPYAGKVAVGDVIATRAIKSNTSLRTVCLASKQFSCWNNRGTMELRMQTMRKHPAWDECVTIAHKISEPGYKPASPATHYANLALCSPAWAAAMKRIAVVGRHTFFVDKT